MRKWRRLALVIDQGESRGRQLRRYLVSVRQIEEATGLDFMSERPDDVETTLETQPAEAMW